MFASLTLPLLLTIFTIAGAVVVLVSIRATALTRTVLPSEVNATAEGCRPTATSSRTRPLCTETSETLSEV